MSLLNFSFIMMKTIHKILVLIKNQLNYLKDNIFEWFFKEYNRLLSFIFLKKFLLFLTCNDEKSKVRRKKLIKDIRNPSRLKRELNYTAIKEIFLHSKKKLKQLKIEYLEILRIFLKIKKKKKISL